MVSSIGCRRFALAIAVLLLSSAFGVLRAQAASYQVIDVAPSRKPQTIPRTDGSWVVWSQNDISGNDTDIESDQLGTSTPIPIASGPAAQTYPDIDNGIAVWATSSPSCPTCEFNIVGKNLQTGNSFTVASTTADETEPAISGSWVVWLSNDGTTITLQARNVETSAPSTKVATISDSPSGRPAISGDRALWAEGSVDASNVAHWRLFTAELPDGNATLIAQGTGGLNGYTLAGNTAVYAAGSQLTVTNLENQRSQIIHADAQNPTTDGRYVFWEDHSFDNATGGKRVDLVAFDLDTQSRFAMVSNVGQNTQPFLRNGVLVWQQSVADQPSQVKAASIKSILPSASRANPETTNTSWTYFEPTGHYLAYGFRSFWNQNGGLPIFGFPLTEEFSQGDVVSGSAYTVQYFERQRFEYHPEFAGTQYETELGRLGYEEARHLAILGTAPFQPLPASTQSDSNCMFFPSTRHRLCFGFRDYWLSHGLDLGDPGISFRESLALFGYPISEEFTDPQTGLTIQYFERAVFEYHPNEPASYQVLLRRLGAAQLTERGW